MALLGNTAVAHPESGEPVVFLAGQDVPDWATPLIGEHLLEVEKPKRAARSSKSE